MLCGIFNISTKTVCRELHERVAPLGVMHKWKLREILDGPISIFLLVFVQIKAVNDLATKSCLCKGLITYQ